MYIVNPSLRVTTNFTRYSSRPWDKQRDFQSTSVIHTVLVSSDQDRITRWSVTYSGPGQYPDPILGPLFELVQYETRVIQLDIPRLGVRATALDDLQSVVGDPPVGAFSGRRFPRYQYGGRADRLSGYIARRSPGDCITLSCRREKQIKEMGDRGYNWQLPVDRIGLRLEAQNWDYEKSSRWKHVELSCHETNISSADN